MILWNDDAMPTNGIEPIVLGMMLRNIVCASQCRLFTSRSSIIEYNLFSKHIWWYYMQQLMESSLISIYGMSLISHIFSYIKNRFSSDSHRFPEWHIPSIDAQSIETVIITECNQGRKWRKWYQWYVSVLSIFLQMLQVKQLFL